MEQKKRKITKAVTQKLRKIKILLTDIDGVLTDGGMYYTETGLSMKKFNVHDGMGSMKLREAGILLGLISSDKSSFGALRGERLGFHFIHIGVWEKEQKLDEICAAAQCSPKEVAYIGDDLNDLGIIAKVGFSAAPANAVQAVKKAVDYICAKKGGEGAYREVADLILKHSAHSSAGRD